MTRREKALEWAIERSFATKTGILFFGAILILAGTELRIDYPVIGYSITFIGLVTDWGIVYLVYREISNIRNEIVQVKDEIEEAKAEIEDTRWEAEEAKDMAEEAGTW
ncbi:hypothetical protein [Halorubrum halophilum]|uniref:hypothetical protein n=1 Tax=Halorubrum halophilum TaxID=413816 RepID=UPI0006796B9E|nr:hypothetical protein [Halorubrum halophilum]